MSKNKHWYIPEASTTAGVKGFMGPMGSDPGKGSQKKKKDRTGYGNLYSEDFQDAVAMNVVSKKEAVRKRPDGQWAVFDDETGAQKSGAFQKRSDAWAQQRRERTAQAGAQAAKGAEQKRQKQALSPDVEKTKATKEKDRPTLARSVAKKEKDRPTLAKKPQTAKSSLLSKQKKKRTESMIRGALYDVLKEASMISYIFENPPQEGSIWENFVGKLTNETIMADMNLKKILQRGAKTEIAMLSRAVKTIGEILNGTGAFSVVPGKMERHTESNDLRMNFEVAMRESNKKLGFSVGMQNSKPLIIFPEDSRVAINSMANHESKLLRAELMHAQETALDIMDDVIKATKSRDNYLTMMERKLDKTLNDLGPLEISLLKYILKKKYRKLK